jgi:hypothetical protein
MPTVEDVMKHELITEVLTGVPVTDTSLIEAFVTDFMTTWNSALLKLEQLASVDGFPDALTKATRGGKSGR